MRSHQVQQSKRGEASVECGEARADLLDLLVQGLCDLWVRMAHNGRAPAAHIVNVLQKEHTPVSNCPQSAKGKKAFRWWPRGIWMPHVPMSVYARGPHRWVMAPEQV